MNSQDVKGRQFMNATELLMRNFNEIFIELDPAKRGTLLAECFAEDLSVDSFWRPDCGPRRYQ